MTDKAADNVSKGSPPLRLRGGRIAKWVLDRISAGVLLILLSPALGTIAVWIMIVDGQPVFFVQLRLGKNGRLFPLLKFRTMVNDAVRIGTELNLTEDPFGVLPNDPRVTRIGRFLRRTGLDELPQLGNVLVGHMSLVGPRPDLPEQVENYSESERRRLQVLPGITGWAQINGREEIPWPQRFALDSWYMDNWSFWLDMRILMRTFGQLFREEPSPIHDAMNIERHRKHD